MAKRKTKILLVDDDASLRHLMTLVLSTAGYAVRSAHDGFSALADIRSDMPDLLLSDLYMPEMSGFEFLSVVRRRFPKIPIVAMSSAYIGPGVPVGIAADVFYAKATNLRDLLEAVGGLCSQRSLKRKDPRCPVWVPRQKDDTEATEIALACTDCMRTFLEVPRKTPLVIREATCLYCSTSIEYAMVQAASYGSVATVPLQMAAA